MAHGALRGNEVLELTSFVEKKAWIDDRIKFLSTQSPVDVAAPLPPATATASEADLEAWWTEHDRIGEEVEAYDMGDLARMRTFARDKSKQALSPRDTDLIEITLSTIFAIDKLLHLLRQRRRSLALLRYRIQWESALELAWSRYKRIVDVDLPTLLGYIRDGGPPDPLVAELASSLSRSISLSASTSCRSLAASASSRDLAASGGSSRNRDQLITLARATLETDVRALTGSLLPAAAAALDKLIDATPTSLPEPFLDEQDRLENAASALGDSLDRFVDDLIRQDTSAETIRAAAVIGDKEARQLVDDATAAVSAGDADKADLRDLVMRLDSLDERLDGIQADLRQIPRPRHSAVPNQPDATAVLVAQLTDLVDMADTTRSSAQEAVRLHALRVEVTSEVVAALEDIRTRAARLRGFLAAQEVLPTGDAGSERQERGHFRPREAVPPHVAAGHRIQGVADDIDAAARSATAVIRLVNRARDADVAVELVRTLKQASAELAAQGRLAASALDSEKIRRNEMHRREERARALRLADQRIYDASARLKAEIESALWTSGASAEAEHDSSSTPFPLPDVEVLLPATSPNLSDGDNDPGTAERANLDRLKEQRDVVERARNQSAVVDEVLREVGAIRSGLHAAAASDHGPLQQLYQGFVTLRDSLHTRVPFLSGAPAVSSFPEVDFEAHDSRIREHLNESIAVLAAIFAQRSADVETQIACGDRKTVFSEPPCLDVFSPTFEPSPTDLPVATNNGAERTLGLLERLDAFTSTRWLAPEAVQLPQFADVRAFDEELQTCRATFDSIYTPPSSEAFQWVDVVEMRQRLKTAETTVARLRDLAAFAGELSLTDAALSDLLIHVDDAVAVASSSVRAESEPSDPTASTAHALATLRIASKPCADDQRVRTALQRVDTTYKSLLAMLAKPAQSTSSLSTLSSRSSQSVHQTERPTSAAVSRRATSPPVDESYRARIGTTPKRPGPLNVTSRSPPCEVPRTPRAGRPLNFSSASTTVTPFSFDTPGHRAAKHLARSQARTPATRLFQDMAHNRRAQPDRSPRHQREHRSTSPSKQALSPRSARKSSTLTPLPAFKGPRQSFRHARANTLQAAVSAVMQQLPFVSIEVAEGRFTEESGVYLVGGRTCFLRLLASKQVRVGGGWLELSQFIVTHFSKDDVLTVSPSRKHLSPTAGQSPGSQRLGLSLSASLRSIDEYLTTVEVSPARRTTVSDSSPTATRRSVARSSSDAVFELENGVSRRSALARSLDGRKSRPKLPVWRP